MDTDQSDIAYIQAISKKRLFYVLVFFVILFVFIVARLFYFQIIRYEEFQKLSQAQQRRTISLPANRGNIYDRKGELYAASIDSYSLYVNPQTISQATTDIASLARLTSFNAQRLGKLLGMKSSFAWVKRKLTKEEENAFRRARHQGIYFSFDKYKKPYVYAVPANMVNREDCARFAAEALQLDYEKVLNNFKRYPDFCIVKERVSDRELDRVKQETYFGFDLIREDKRIYLKGVRAAHVLGYVGIDNQGLGGIEYGLDSEMKGREGKLVVENDRKGNEIFMHTRKVQQPQNGKDIYLTIDNYIQYVAEQEISRAVKDFKAIRGMVVVMEPESGDILAMATYPTFDPNRFHTYPGSVLINDVVSYVYEPGSTFKIVTVASALETGTIDESTRIQCPATLKVGGRTIREAHHDPEGQNKVKILTAREILRDSLNVGVAQIGMMMGQKKLYQKIREFGFGEPTGVDLPGESSGIVNHYRKWYESDGAIIPFGHSISATALQVVNSVAAVCNDGMLMKPKVVKKVASYDEHYVQTMPSKEIRQVISRENAALVRDMMRDVVTTGTGTEADIPGYSVIGKTGTAQKIDTAVGGYKYGAYITSFVGALPKDDPKLVALVVIDEPKTNIYASYTAAPVFRNVMTKIIHYLAIPPDIEVQDGKDNN